MVELIAHRGGSLQLGELTFRCALGKNGVAADKREGDGCSPLGRYPLRFGYYRPDRLERPDSPLPFTPLTPEMGWCDDPRDPAYNRPVTLPYAASHERLWRDDHVYDLIIVLGHNDDPPQPDLGSAIFFHLAQPDFRGTEGCVAVAQSDMLSLLSLLDGDDYMTITET